MPAFAGMTNPESIVLPDQQMQRGDRLRSYGRRKARPLSERKDRLLNELLPTLRLPLAEPAPSPLTSLFAQPVDEVWLEIGFGSGEHLVWQAEQHPECRLHRLRALHQRRGEPARQDRDLAASTPSASTIATPATCSPGCRRIRYRRIFILFPDPWPKKRHQKRRLVSPDAVADFARVLRQGGELRFASDSGDYVGEALLTIPASRAFAWTAERPKDWRIRPCDWPETRYERKALSEGRKPAYLSFRRL